MIKVIKKLSGLVEENNKFSLGRISFWIFTFCIIYYWLKFDKDIPPNIMIVYITLISYNLFKKPIRVFETYLNKGQVNDTKVFNDN